LAHCFFILVMVLLAAVVAVALAAGIYGFLVARDYRRQNEWVASFVVQSLDEADETPPPHDPSAWPFFSFLNASLRLTARVPGRRTLPVPVQ